MYMTKKNATTLPLQQITKNRFVVVQEAENCFEIGLVRETELQKDHKELKILILTAGAFHTNVPIFRSIWDPFLPTPMEEIAIDIYPVYALDIHLLAELFDQQKNYLETHLPAGQKELDAFLTMKKLVFDPHISTHA